VAFSRAKGSVEREVGLDERDFDPWGDRLIAVVPGWA
jgi:hypothetical protein